MIQLKSLRFQIFPKRYGFFPYMFLVYLALPVFYIAGETGLRRIIGFILLGIFLFTYRQLYFSVSNVVAFSYCLAIQMAIVFLFSMFYDPNLLFMGFFPANFIGWYFDKKKFKIALISFILMELIPAFYHGLFFSTNTLYILPFLVIMILSPFGIRSMNKRMELEKQLDQANEKIKELVKREERTRIARDLHDTLGHTLSLITLKSQLVEKLTKIDPERAQIEAKEIEKTSRSALKQVRELVSSMRAITIAEELIQVQEILQAAGIAYHHEGLTDLSNIPPLTQNIISMCLKEAVTNVVKHSKAKNCSITIQSTTDSLRFIVKDDGIGLNNKNENGNGLKGMEERLSLIDGILLLSHQKGTSLELQIPIIKKLEKEGAVV
ncbi:sensor histidine kinase [Heyndrickxia oleronia]|uniref:sensor histidine kinase n=1 Tax=Heyndrickxia oleronia TaxID=38875 RepID=UPI000903284F|nr:sensor histidine kinase [Heyndrickxia oleronia]NYV66817.1 sensor histidine kinase [Bacillus sp. Gen3]OJH16740.1 two-component sensor histidine kinase [Bacillus obstructivus]MBU5212237.1 sensor histidine kinase [Heyndrickxia oleronia]MCI1592194.1 sensor histidine kinase [Heyndrickxia oleronia]MCI1615314.1 sensor histidine kinase [Heyndrickxia oleronia]